MNDVVIRASGLRDFIRKVSLGQEIDLPLVVKGNNEIKVDYKTLAMKISGVMSGDVDIKGIGEDESLILGIPNTKRFIKYLTVLGDDFFMVKKDIQDIEKLFLVSGDGEMTFEVILSSITQPDVSPMKLEGFFVEKELTPEQVKRIFETLRLITSDECGVEIIRDDETGNWQVGFRVGSRLEDKGRVTIATLDEIPDMGDNRFVIKLSDDSYFIKFHHQDIISTFGVLNKNEGASVKFQLKSSGALVISELTDNYSIHFGFVPYV